MEPLRLNGLTSEECNAITKKVFGTSIYLTHDPNSTEPAFGVRVVEIHMQLLSLIKFFSEVATELYGPQ